MTPDDFPTREAYLKYVRECEESLIYSDTWENNNLSFEEATEPCMPQEHYKECQDKDHPYCWCRGNEDGLVEYWVRGMVTASHTTSPVFTFKFDHGYGEDDCGVCRPERFYWDDDGRPLSRARAEEEFWKDYREGVRYSCSEYLGLDDPLALPEPDKIGPHP